MTWLAENFYTLLIVLGIGLLALEVAVFGFSVFILFFIGLACIVTGGLVGVGVMPNSVTFAFLSVAVLSGVFAYALWEPLKRMQNSGGSAGDIKGDFIGHSFVLKEPVSPTQYSSHRLSGVDWKVRSDTSIAAGAWVQVTRVAVGELTVAVK